jgi:hypothetical protein
VSRLKPGGEPKELVSTLRRSNPNTPSQGYALRPTNPNALSHVPTEELLLELRRRIIAPRDTRHNTWDTWDGSLDPHGDWPEQGAGHCPTPECRASRFAEIPKMANVRARVLSVSRYGLFRDEGIAKA